MSKTMSLRLTEEQLAAVERIKRRYHQPSISSTLNLLLTEKLREIEHPNIIFRDTAIGRRAFLYGTRLKMWMILMVARDYDCDVARMAKHLSVFESDIQAALDYIAKYPDEAEEDLRANEEIDFEALKRILPNIQQTIVPDDYEVTARVEPAS